MKSKQELFFRLSTVVLLGISAMLFASCGGALTDQDEVAQTAADVVASLDETLAGTTTTMAFNLKGSNSKFALANEPTFNLYDILFPSAHAISCWRYGGVGVVPCTNTAANVYSVTRTFNSCTMAAGAVAYSGTVRLDYSTSNCQLGAGLSVTRVPNFTITGRLGAILTVSGEGQKLTVNSTGTTYSYAVLGMRRVAINASGTIFDISTRTTADITVIPGNPLYPLTRTGRVMTGGTLEVTHNLKNYTVSLSPANLTWNETCNCPISGRLTGTATGSQKADSVIIEVTGCGTGKVTSNSETVDVTFDRCVAASAA